MTLLQSLALSVDSFVAALALAPIVRSNRGKVAACFGIADAGGFLIGSVVSWHLPRVVPALVIAAYAAYLLFAVGVTRHAASKLPIWVLPVVFALDNVATGMAHGRTSLLQSAAGQGCASALLALVGLLLGAALTRPLRPVTARRLSGAGLLAAAAVLALS